VEDIRKEFNVKPLSSQSSNDQDAITRSCLVKSSVHSYRDQVVPLKLLKKVPCLPACFSWAPVTQNFTVDDETTLQNLPYMGDDNSADLNEFYNELVKSVYEGKVHGEGDETNFIGDDMLVDMVTRLHDDLKQHLRAGAIKKGKPLTSEDDDVPPNQVFQVLSQFSPDKGTPQEIRAKWLQLSLEKDPSSNVRPETSVTPNMDGPEARSVSRKRAMNSYHELFCRRCYKFDCLQHETRCQPNLKQSRKRMTDVQPPTAPTSVCGDECFLTLDGVPEFFNHHKKRLQKSIYRHKPWMLKNANKNCDVINRDVTTNSRDVTPTRSATTTPSGSENESGTNNSNDVKSSSLETDTESSASQSSLQTHNMTSQDLPRDLLAKARDWPNRMQSLYRVYCDVYPLNYCVISQLMGGEISCKETFAFSLLDRDRLMTSSHNSGDATQGDFPDKGKDPLDIELSPPKKKKNKKSRMSQMKRQMQRKREKSDVTSHYHPCECSSKGCDDNCNCVREGTFCEKFCLCPSDCTNRFLGCKCKSHCQTKVCPCFLAARECDPDICSCGADHFTPQLQSVLKGETGRLVQSKCRNVAIQRGQHKHLLMAPSDISGWGIFIKEPVHNKMEFISEYCGERISQDEADRRGKVYDKIKVSFLFNLNKDYVVDATRKGNKIRFANHSINPNCCAKVMRVNGDDRIGIFSNRPIRAGEELFFDYSYSSSDAVKYVGIERETVASVSDSNGGGSHKS